MISPHKLIHCYPRRFFGSLILLFLMSGCGSPLLMTSEERAAISFSSGTRAFEMDDYSKAVGFLRQIPPESSLYSQSMQMILKVPFQRGRLAYEKQKYTLAVREFRKTDSRSPDYEKAQWFLKMSLIEMNYERLPELEGKERLEALGEMTRLSVELGETDVLNSSLELVSRELAESTTKEETDELLKIMSSMIAVIKEPKTLQMTLEQLLGDFDRLHAYAELRPRIFQLIGSIKMGLL